MFPIIPHSARTFQYFADDLSTRKIVPRWYGKLHRSDYRLPRSHFLLLSRVALLANFQRGTMHIGPTRRAIQSETGRRTYFRAARSLERTGRILRLSRSTVYYPYRRGSRPINQAVLSLVHTRQTAGWIQFLVWLAHQRGPWSGLTVDRIQRALRIERSQAMEYRAWIRNGASGLDTKRLRAIVFYSAKPNWRAYRNGARRPGEQLGPIEAGKREKRLSSDYVTAWKSRIIGALKLVSPLSPPGESSRYGSHQTGSASGRVAGRIQTAAGSLRRIRAARKRGPKASMEGVGVCLNGHSRKDPNVLDTTPIREILLAYMPPALAAEMTRRKGWGDSSTTSRNRQSVNGHIENRIPEKGGNENSRAYQPNLFTSVKRPADNTHYVTLNGSTEGKGHE
jgi:hypothetical protein